MVETLIESITSPQFLDGLLFGAAALALGLVGAFAWRRTAPVTSLLWVVAVLGALYWSQGIAESTLLGLGLLTLAGLVDRPLTGVAIPKPLLALPGAWMVAQGVSEPVWAPWLVLGVVVVGGPLTAATDRRLEPPSLGIFLWAITLGGVYATVPDTEEALVLLGAVAPLVVLALFRLTGFGAVGAYPAVGLLAWATATGGIGRPASMVGALACLGLFLVGPLAERIRPGSPRSRVVPTLVHVGVVAVCSRVAGLHQSVALALGLSVGGLAVATLALVLIPRKR